MLCPPVQGIRHIPHGSTHPVTNAGYRRTVASSAALHARRQHGTEHVAGKHRIAGRQQHSGRNIRAIFQAERLICEAGPYVPSASPVHRQQFHYVLSVWLYCIARTIVGSSVREGIIVCVRQKTDRKSVCRTAI